MALETYQECCKLCSMIMSETPADFLGIYLKLKENFEPSKNLLTLVFSVRLSLSDVMCMNFFSLLKFFCLFACLFFNQVVQWDVGLL